MDEDELGLPGCKPTARWRYAQGTGIADNNPLGKKNQKEPKPERGDGQTGQPAETEREAG
jgi:hypothetical protein